MIVGLITAEVVASRWRAVIDEITHDVLPLAGDKVRDVRARATLQVQIAGRIIGKLLPTRFLAPVEQAHSAALRSAPDDAPEGTAASLLLCADMLTTWAPECFPVDGAGQVHFARVMMEATAAEIRAFLAVSEAGR